MKKAIKISLIALVVMTVISILVYIPIWREDALARKNKSRVEQLIKVDQNLNQAEVILKQAGFRLLYEEPIAPTINKDYLQQIVIIGDTRLHAYESLVYELQIPWMPFMRNESPYVVINATLDGSITDIK